MKTALNDIDDLDDILLEVEETEVDAVGPLNLASEEIGVIRQESNDDHFDNTISLVLKCGDISRIIDETVCECKYVSDSQLCLSPPNASNLPGNYLVIDAPASNLCDVSTDVTVLKVEQEVNQSLNSVQHNPNSLHEGGDIKESNRPYYLSAEEVALLGLPPVCAGEAVDERSHAGSSSEADSRKPSETLAANPATCSPDSLKDRKLKFWEQMTSERVVSFIEEKASDAEVKKNFRSPVQTEHKAKKQKTSPSCKQDASKLKKRIVEAVKKKNIQQCNPAKQAPAKQAPVKKAPEYKRRQRTWLNFVSEVEIERRKHLYLQFVSNHLNNGHESQGPMQELLCLMDQVAERECRNHSSSWQHPSDLTTRNYSRQNMNSFNKPNLYQWANSNGQFYRFSGMPDGFQRSPIL
ncbi:S100P-binding protein-like [Scyliorhinus canicula]|uniref:S100P-binding protein-like n=1 Tax=Scyliorhinus canicula TaxID=7830 RepID=UPI0018F5F321|nr:S100P-binding protein-like [Scyliorhinus canicula]